jgi:hypothetical protein
MEFQWNSRFQAIAVPLDAFLFVGLGFLHFNQENRQTLHPLR